MARSRAPGAQRRWYADSLMRRSRGDGRAARRALGISLLIASSALCLPTQGALECSFSFERVGNGPDFRHATGATGAKHLPESMGAGAAWLDYDGDGWLDLYASTGFMSFNRNKPDG